MEIFNFDSVNKYLKLDKKVIRFSFSILIAKLSIILRLSISNYYFFYNSFLLVLGTYFLQTFKP